MAKCPYCGLEDVNTVEQVRAGCNQINAALDKFSNVAVLASEASAILNHNNLQFGGGENGSLEQSLDELQVMFAKSVNNNEGLTQQIIDAANAQQAAWENNVASCKKKAELNTKKKN